MLIAKAVSSASTYYGLFGFRGIARRMLVRALGAECSVAVPGSSDKVVIRFGTTDVAAFEHVFRNREYDVSLSREPRVIVDLGANVGMSAAYFAIRYPQARVIAVEPDFENFKILEKNAGIYRNIEPLNAALWNRNGTISLAGRRGTWGSRVAEDGDAPVRAVTMSTVLEEFKISHVDLLKIDIEGSECEMLESAPAWIDRVDVVCAELHDRFRPGCTTAFEMATAGFAKRWSRDQTTWAARPAATLQS